MAAAPPATSRRIRPTRVEPWRTVLLKERDREVDWIVALQKHRTPFLDRFFSIASMLGEELFYILFLPLSAWVISSQFTAHLTILLAMSVGIGNILKNFFLIPRPPHPPVWVHTDSEKDHGLPSTHTMTAVTLPWYYIFFHSYMEPMQPLHPAVTVLALAWTVSVAMSRLYNGHHTPMDVVAGALLGVLLLVVFVVQLRPLVDSFILGNRTWTGVLTLVAAGVSILALHPVPPKVLTPAHAETGLVTGTATGTCLGLWFRVSHDPRSVYALFNSSPAPPSILLLLQQSPSMIMIVYLLRFLVGVLIVAATRFVVKKAATSLVLWISRLASIRSAKTAAAAAAAFKYSEAEVAIKYITYSAIGFGATWTAPIVFALMYLHLPLDDVIIAKV